MYKKYENWAHIIKMFNRNRHLMLSLENANYFTCIIWSVELLQTISHKVLDL